jgi:DNA invertase Pin-like site-specific DNA recombinase
MDITEEVSRAKAYSYIRMSRDTQLKGDSLRRQREACQSYANRHGLELVDDFALEDLGVSGWTGANIQSGNLGRFLEAVKRGEVAKGSYLLVEAFDRISRLKPLQALQPVLDLVNNGIVVVTLDDEKQFAGDTVDFADLIVSIAKMSRANEESARKSDRVGKAWANKRKQADELKLTKRCPAWLQLSADRRSFSVSEERAKIVRRIFDETVSGLGVYSIARRLNAEGVPAFVSRKGWQLSSIHKLITSRTVIGEYQPNRLINGKRVPDGDPIKDYYPRVIDENLYNAAHNARSIRREAGGGRTGKRVSNLFSKLAVCRDCGSSMHFESKGTGPRGGTYLVCDNVRRNMGCPSVRWRYNDFEASFLAFVSELDLGSVLETDSDGEKRAAIERRVEALKGELSQIEDERGAAFELLKRGISVDFVAAKMAKCDERIAELKVNLDTAHAERRHIAESAGRLYSSDDLHELIARLRTHSGEEVYRQRSKVAARLKAIIKEIVVAPSKVRVFKGDKAEVADLSNFEVCFRNGAARIVYPDPNDPLKFAQQVVGAGKKLDVIDPDGHCYPMDDEYEHDDELVIG